MSLILGENSQQFLREQANEAESEIERIISALGTALGKRGLRGQIKQVFKITLDHSEQNAESTIVQRSVTQSFQR